MGTTTAPPAAAPTATNPYALPPALQAYMTGIQGLGQAVGASSTPQGSAGYMRGNPGSSWNQGTPDALLDQILQMRAAQTAGLGAPYQQGTAMPRVSLLQG